MLDQRDLLVGIWALFQRRLLLCKARLLLGATLMFVLGKSSLNEIGGGGGCVVL